MTKPNQRNSPRTSLDGAVEVLDIESGIEFRASAVNVSDGGLLFDAPMEPALGAQMVVSVPGQASSPQEFKVLRIEPNGPRFTVAVSCITRAA